jgi:hypothetical protein
MKRVREKGVGHSPLGRGSALTPQAVHTSRHPKAGSWLLDRPGRKARTWQYKKQDQRTRVSHSGIWRGSAWWQHVHNGVYCRQQGSNREGAGSEGRGVG